MYVQLLLIARHNIPHTDCNFSELSPFHSTDCFLVPHSCMGCMHAVCVCYGQGWHSMITCEHVLNVVARVACALMVHALVSLRPNSFFLTKLLLQAELFLSSAGVMTLPPAHPTSYNHIYSLIIILINLLTKITEYNSTGNRANHTP